jgi:hypothetical protein
MLESIKGLSGWCRKDYKRSIGFEDEEFWNKMNQMVIKTWQGQLDLEANHQCKSLEDKQNIILKMDKSMQGLQTTHIEIWCWIDEFWEQKEGLRGIGPFYHKRWYIGKYGLGVFRKGIVKDDNLHKKKCSRLFIGMSICNILFNCNMWLIVEEIKME